MDDNILSIIPKNKVPDNELIDSLNTLLEGIPRAIAFKTGDYWVFMGSATIEEKCTMLAMLQADLNKCLME